MSYIPRWYKFEQQDINNYEQENNMQNFLCQTVMETSYKK